jgi:predicted aspartyl protease
MRRPVAWLTVAWLGATLATARDFPPALQPRTLAPLGYEFVPLQHSAEGHLYARARANGHRCVALVDTGWSFATLSSQKANRIFKVPTGIASGGSGAVLDRLELGTNVFLNQPVRVEPLVFDGQPASFDLVLGLDFLRQQFALLDCARGRLYFRRTAPPSADRQALETLLRERGFAAAPLTFTEPPALTCRARLNGRPVELLVDSAAVWSALDAGELQRFDLRGEPTLARVTGAGRTGTRPVLVAAPRAFEVGTVTLPAARFAVFELADWGMAATNAPLPHVSGILGSPELRALEALVDCDGLKLWIRAPRSRR